MNWVQRADVYVLALLLAYSVAIFLTASWRCSSLRRASEIDSRRRKKVVADLKSGASSLQSIAVSAPYLGLAGTCFGILGALRGFDGARAAVVAMLAGALAAALLTTVAGIVVAVAATFFYNNLCPRIAFVASEICNEGGGPSRTSKKPFSQLPAFALIAASGLAMGVLWYLSLGSFREPKGLDVEVARCESGMGDRVIVLRITSGGKLFLNTEQQNWDTLSRRLAEIYGSRRRRVLYLAADDGVPFQGVADAIGIAQNAAMGSSRLNIRVRLAIPKAAECPDPVMNRR